MGGAPRNEITSWKLSALHIRECWIGMASYPVLGSAFACLRTWPENQELSLKVKGSLDWWEKTDADIGSSSLFDWDIRGRTDVFLDKDSSLQPFNPSQIPVSTLSPTVGHQAALSHLEVCYRWFAKALVCSWNSSFCLWPCSLELNLLFWKLIICFFLNSCILMPFFSVSSTCVKTWTLVHLPRFVFNGYSDHVGYFCCSYTVGVSESTDDEPNHKHGFHRSVQLMKDTLMAPMFTSWLWFSRKPGTDEQGLSMEAPWKVTIGHDRPPLYLDGPNGQNAEDRWITVDDPLATRNRLVPGFFCSLTRWGFGWQSGVCLMNTYNEMV